MSEALKLLAARLRDEDTPISPHVTDPPDRSAAANLSAERDFVVEAVREGYLLHYGEPRLLSGHDDDLALLAGDYLYALGIERLAALGDTGAVLILAELISASAQLHAEGREQEAPGRWRDAVHAIGTGA
ncbi:MAG TPA: hypothetical protein VFN89_00885 [Solirubrobacterales bacterium]|nr:hypothetical protein [Solirubrobacterales bacterium]